MDNDGAEVHIGENCLFQMTASNIMQFVSDPDYENQTARIISSDGITDTIDNNSGCSNTEKNSAELRNQIIEQLTPPSKTTVQQDIQSLNILIDSGTGSSLKMDGEKVILQTGLSSITLNANGQIDIKGVKINIGGASVHLGAAVNLGLVPDLGFNTPQKCTMTTGDVEWTSKNVEWKPTKINIS